MKSIWDREWTVKRDISLLDFLIAKSISNRLYIKLKKTGNIELNGKKKIKKKLKAGDVLRLRFEDENENFAPVEGDIKILYEDADLLVVEKPAFLTTVSENKELMTLANHISHYFRKMDLKRSVRFVNRLDRDTTGMVIIAKNPLAQAKLVKEGYEKTYIAICEGEFQKSSGRIEEKLNEDDPPAITDYEVIDYRGGLSLVKFNLKTGKTHQIRLHSKLIRRPILGDELYNKSSELIQRQALHFYKTSFNLVSEAKRIELVSEIPDDILKVIELKNLKF